MSTEHLLVRELVLALSGLALGSMVARSPLVEPYKAGALYGIAGITTFWALRLAGLI